MQQGEIDNQIVVYENGEVEIEVSFDNQNETIWLSQLQMSKLLETSTDNISLHLKNIFREIELDESSTTEYFSVVRKEGKRTVKRKIKHYNLDVVISVGYRVSSRKATKFRQWATSVLKQYIYSGYAINHHKITEQRLLSLETDMQMIKSKIKNNELELKQGIFYSGQIYDAYMFVNNLLKSATREITLIDNYIDDTVLTLFAKYAKIQYTIITNPKNLSRHLKLDIDRYNKQYTNLTIKTTDKFHDRFLLIDDKEAYHIGASLKDLAKKIFAFSKIDIQLLQPLEVLYEL